MKVAGTGGVQSMKRRAFSLGLACWQPHVLTLKESFFAGLFMLQAFVALVRREQEEAEQARKKEEEEKKKQREDQQRKKRMLEAAFEGDVEEMKAILKEVKMSLWLLFPVLHQVASN